MQYAMAFCSRSARHQATRVAAPNRSTVAAGLLLRLFGSKPDSGVNGALYFENNQNDLTDIDETRIQNTVRDIQRYIGYETYDVSLALITDDEMAEINRDSRGINQPTDILSFPMHQPIEAGKLEPPDFDIPDYYNLGDMVIDVAYVIRRCQEDQADNDPVLERGVSGAMASVYDPEVRIHMLLVHGMLHLVGYDHEADEEYEEMVAKEEEILKALKLVG